MSFFTKVFWDSVLLWANQVFGQRDDNKLVFARVHNPLTHNHTNLVLNWQHVQRHHVRWVMGKSRVNFGVPAISSRFFCGL